MRQHALDRGVRKHEGVVVVQERRYVDCAYEHEFPGPVQVEGPPSLPALEALTQEVAQPGYRGARENIREERPVSQELIVLAQQLRHYNNFSIFNLFNDGAQRHPDQGSYRSQEAH